MSKKLLLISILSLTACVSSTDYSKLNFFNAVEGKQSCTTGEYTLAGQYSGTVGKNEPKEVQIREFVCANKNVGSLDGKTYSFQQLKEYQTNKEDDQGTLFVPRGYGNFKYLYK